MRTPSSRVRCANAEGEQSVEADRRNHQREARKGFEQSRNQRLRAEGVFHGLVDGFHAGRGRVGSDLVQSLVELGTQRTGRNRGTDGNLNKGAVMP